MKTIILRGKGRHLLLSANDLKMAKNTEKTPKVNNWRTKLLKYSLINTHERLSGQLFQY